MNPAQFTVENYTSYPKQAILFGLKKHLTSKNLGSDDGIHITATASTDTYLERATIDVSKRCYLIRIVSPTENQVFPDRFYLNDKYYTIRLNENPLFKNISDTQLDTVIDNQTEFKIQVPANTIYIITVFLQ